MDSYRSLLLLAELEREEALSQRELSRRLGVALGLVNSYLKHLISKGFVRVMAFPRNRYGYLLTPQGIAEKSRLAYRHLSYFTNLYTATREDYRALFSRLAAAGTPRVVFCGVDEVAEIAYLSLQETPLDLVAVMDHERVGMDFFGRTICGITAHTEFDDAQIVVTSLKRGTLLREQLLIGGVASQRIHTVGHIKQDQEER